MKEKIACFLEHFIPQLMGPNRKGSLILGLKVECSDVAFKPIRAQLCILGLIPLSVVAILS